MVLFDHAYVLILLVTLAGCLFLMSRALIRLYHWKRSRERMERFDWLRMVRSMPASREEIL